MMMIDDDDECDDAGGACNYDDVMFVYVYVYLYDICLGCKWPSLRGSVLTFLAAAPAWHQVMYDGRVMLCKYHVQCIALHAF